MPSLVRTTRRDSLLLVAIENPPVNALTREVLRGLDDAMTEAARNPAISAVVIHGSGSTFVAGADIREFPLIADGKAPPIDFNATLNRVENCAKPVVAALHGSVLGGGNELAMACHWRVAAKGTSFGQPEVKLGLIPGAGGTQRLPRLVGVDKAMEMCVLGEPVKAGVALSLGLIDEEVNEDVLEAACRLAGDATVRRTRDRIDKLVEPPQAESFAELWREKAAQKLKSQVAPLAALDAILAACRLGFDDGLAVEKRLFDEVLAGPQAAALIHLFFAERSVGKVAGVGKTVRPAAIEHVAILGAGTMGRGIATAFLNRGFRVSVFDENPDALEAAGAGVRKNLEGAVARGLLSNTEARERFERLRTCKEIGESVANAQLAIEAVYEDGGIKKTVLNNASACVNDDCLIASNTSTLDIDSLAQATRRPDRFLGLHFFSPAHVMRLLEIVRGKETSPGTLATGLDLAKRLKKTGVVSGNRYGFIGNRMFMPYREQAVQIVEEGAEPCKVDRSLTNWGMAMGPLAVGDLSGLDVFQMMRKEALRRGFHFEAQTFEDVLCGQGRTGRKAGAGWYCYDSAGRMQEDENLIDEIRQYAASQGIVQRHFTARDIRERTLLAMINEGARLLEESVAERASDLDVVYVHGYGFPAWRGGPMHAADVFGLPFIVDALQQFYDEAGPAWRPSALLVDLMRSGKRIAEYAVTSRGSS